MEQIDLLEYRTVDSVQLANPSRNLVDTIHEMENIQDLIISGQIFTFTAGIVQPPSIKSSYL